MGLPDCRRRGRTVHYDGLSYLSYHIERDQLREAPPLARAHRGGTPPANIVSKVMAMIRPAVAADLSRVGQIWAANQDEGAIEAAVVPSLYAHELATRELVVAEHAGIVVGFASLITRDRVGFLADLFVDPAHQSGGIGGELLRHVLPGDGGLYCTFSSSDPRALSLYIRARMRPYWPNFQLRGSLQRFSEARSGDLQVVEAQPADPELIEWDGTIGGRSRAVDHAYWVGKRGGVPFWFLRRGQKVGYGYAQTLSDDVVAAPDTLTLGPLGVADGADAAACVMTALHWVKRRAAQVRISVPAPHSALGPLLELGLHIHDVDTFCSSDEPDFVDVRRYIPSGSDLF